jgi:hypothetical protein
MGMSISTVHVLICSTLTGAIPTNPVYPLYKQCYPEWAGDKMGLANCSVSTCAGATFGRDTVCSEGCAMTCISMALTSYGYKINGKSPDPGTLNAWLVDNEGYLCLDGNCNNLALEQVQKIDVYGNIKFLGEIFRPSLTQGYLVKALDSGMVVIGHVRNRTHFVLLNGSENDGDVFTVMDPFYNSTTYTYEDITDAIVYAM